MSDQLTLEGLLPPPEESKTTKAESKAPAKKKSVTKKTKAEEAIEARIKALIDQKTKTETLQAAKAEEKERELLQAMQSPETRAFNEQIKNGKESQPTTKTQITTATVGVVKAAKGKTLQAEFISQTTILTDERGSGLEAETQGEGELELGPQVDAEPEVLTVTSLNRGIKNLLEKTYPFLWVKGEISNLKIPSSGHLYFTLKDSASQIRAVMFRGFAQGMKFKPEDGMEVLVRCKVTAYEPRGDYQLFCEVMEPVGFGALQIAFEKLKNKLQAEGLFDASRKRPLPAFPNRIGIITSPTGAAIRDMLNVLGRRMGGGLDITILPTSVQGDKAPGEIVKAIELANRLGTERFDVLIIGRGGGSLEDMWSFNMEEVVRAVSKSRIPTISAVGHEVDFTICDFVADLRAPTPSAAAELVVKNKKDLLDRLGLLHRHVVQQIHKKLQIAGTRSEHLAKRLIDPKRRLQDLMLRCDEWSERLATSMFRFLQDNAVAVKFLRERLGSPQERLELCEQKFNSLQQRLGTGIETQVQKKHTHLGRLASLLHGLSPLSILGRGYSIVKKGSEIIKDATQVQKDDIVTITLHQGEIKSKIQ